MKMNERDREAMSDELEDAIECEDIDEVFENDNEDMLQKMYDG